MRGFRELPENDRNREKKEAAVSCPDEAPEIGINGSTREAAVSFHEVREIGINGK